MNRKLTVSFLIVPLLMACGSKAGEEKPDDSDMLYKETLRLITLYTDSIGAATDSVGAEEAFAGFSAQIDSLNMAVEPNTDLLLTEGENDTIYRRITALRTLYDNKLAEFGHKTAHSEQNDSIENDAD